MGIHIWILPVKIALSLRKQKYIKWRPSSPILNIIGDTSFRLGGLQVILVDKIICDSFELRRLIILFKL